jgi:hypothetical protein
MIKFFLKSIFQILLLTFLLTITQFLIFRNSVYGLTNPFVIKSYMFLLVLNIISFLLLLIVKIKKPDYVGYTFLGLVLIKMIVSFTFLFPTINSEISNKQNIILMFFALYFIYLMFETIISVKLINLEK